VALRRAHTRENQERPLAAPVPDPEKIIRRGKYLQRQTSRYARACKLGISTNTSSFVSKEPLVESPCAETSSSQKIEIVLENLKGEDPSISSNIIDSISEHVITSNLREEVVGSLQKKDSSSSSNSSPTKPIEGVFHTHTSLPILEDILQDISSKGEENLALLLNHFYRASYFPPYLGNFAQGSHPTSVSPSFLSEVTQPLFIVVQQHRYSNRGRTPSVTTHINRSKINTPMFSRGKTPTGKHPWPQPMRPLGAVY
jgi:hypothetical protein